MLARKRGERLRSGMSRSFKRTPIAGIATGASDSQGKRQANSSLRSRTRDALGMEQDVMPLLREVSNVYSFPKDGKRWFDKLKYPKMLRK